MMDCPFQLDKGLWTCPDCGWRYPLKTETPPKRNCTKPPSEKTTPVGFVGNILHDILLYEHNIDMVAGCGCQKWIDLMNAWGPDGCRENHATIVGGLLSEAKRRKWAFNDRPVLSAVAKIGTLLPGGLAFARAWARRIVTEAINRSENEITDDVGLWCNDRAGPGA